MVHLQCHFGLDTLSWAREGAVVTGVDFAPAAVAAARDLARQAGIGAEFVEAGVYDAATALRGRTFDAVYTSIGVIIWLPDITRWASTVAALLAPGGRFYMAEFHPFSVVLGEEDLTVTDSYFDPGPFLHDEPGSYADPDAQTAHHQSPEAGDLGIPSNLPCTPQMGIAGKPPAVQICGSRSASPWADHSNRTSQSPTGRMRSGADGQVGANVRRH